MKNESTKGKGSKDHLLDIVSGIEDLAMTADVSLDSELDALRQVLARSSEHGLDPLNAVVFLSRASGQLATLLGAKSRLSDDPAGQLAGAFADAMDDLAKELGIEAQ